MLLLGNLVAGLPLWLLLFLEAVNAQNWAIYGASSYQDSMIRPAWNQAIEIAAKSSSMLSTRMGEDKVRDTVRLILGVNGNTDWAKYHLASVAQYNKQSSQVTASNKDVYVLANGDYLQTTSHGTGLWNSYQSQWVGANQANIYNECNTKTQIGPGMNSFALTTSSDIVDVQRYQDAVNAWYANPDSTTAPILSQYSTPRPQVPNLLNLCKLALLQNVFDSTITTSMLRDGAAYNLPLTQVHEGVQSNYLLKQLSGTILHELTHTNLGGRANDFPPDKCYGWECVKYGKTSGHNADTVAFLGIALWMIDEGYYVGPFGGIKKI